MLRMVSVDVLRSVFAEGGADGCKRLLQFVRQGLNEKKFTAEQISLRNVGLVMGAIDAYDESGSFRRGVAQSRSTEVYTPEQLFVESNPGLYSNAFQIVTTELISNQVIAGYESMAAMGIADELCTTMTVTRRATKVAGFTSLAGPLEVQEGHPYPESGFDEKSVTTLESKKGRILSLNEELILFDQTGEIARRARMMGEYLRQERDRTIVRGVQDADATARYVYRPSGVAELLYATDASNKNYIGSGGLTGYNAAVALQDWTDLEHVAIFRATQVKDDRVDGTPLPLMGLNGPQNILLVPETLAFTADHIVGGTENQSNTDSAVREARFQSRTRAMVGKILSSPFIDEVNTADWYYGDFKRQFLWTEVYGPQTFMQGSDSEASFERDVAMRIKVRYYGGLSATDTVYVTKVKGA